MVAGNIFYVPWPDFSEWNTVREQIFSSDVQDTIAAYHTILMWKLKYDSVPAYIECTYSLLQVMVKEYEMTKNTQNSLLFNEHDLQLSYSTALIRFVNHVSSISSYKGETLYLAAKTQNIPDWIINMRHDVAHGQDLPSLEALHIAAELSLKWLLDNYWGNTENCEQKSGEVSQFDIDSGFPQEIDIDAQNFFKKFLNIWELYHDKKYARVQFIAEVDREFILHVEEILSLHNVYFNNIESGANVEIQNIVNNYNQMEENGDFEFANSCKLKEFKNLLLVFLKSIIKENDGLKHSLVFALLETTFLCGKWETDYWQAHHLSADTVFVLLVDHCESCLKLWGSSLRKLHTISKDYNFLLESNFSPKKWEQILWLLQETGSFSFLLEILFQIAGRGHKGASRILSLLPASLKHLKKQWAIFKVLKKESKNFKTKVLKKKIQKTCKPTGHNLALALDIFKPPVITLEMVKNILLNPEQFAVENIVEYLQLVKPPLMKVTIDMIKDLVSLHMVGEGGEEVGDVSEEKIFTVEDLDKMMEAEDGLVFEEAVGETDGWVKSSIDVKAWNKCPLGLLPFQVRVNCNLPEDLTWEKKSTTRKRVSIPLLMHSVSMKKFRET